MNRKMLWIALLAAVALAVGSTQVLADGGSSAQGGSPPVLPKAGSTTYLLQLGSVQGDSMVDGHQGWIHVASFSVGASRSLNASAGGAAASSVQAAPLVVTRLMDTASAPIFAAFGAGSALGQAVLDLCVTINDKTTAYATFTLTAPAIAGIEYGVLDDGEPYERMTLAYQKLTIAYKGMSATGTTTSSTSGSATTGAQTSTQAGGQTGGGTKAILDRALGGIRRRTK
jgi:type VI secretion system Hcp family effector